MLKYFPLELGGQWCALCNVFDQKNVATTFTKLSSRSRNIFILSLNSMCIFSQWTNVWMVKLPWAVLLYSTAKLSHPAEIYISNLFHMYGCSGHLAIWKAFHTLTSFLNLGIWKPQNSSRKAMRLFEKNCKIDFVYCSSCGPLYCNWWLWRSPKNPVCKKTALYYITSEHT